MEFGVRVTGWNGNMHLGSLEPPNWLVVVAAIGVATLCWLKVTSMWAAPAALLFGLAGYGLLHAGDILVCLMTSDTRSAAIGSFLTVIGFAGILVALSSGTPGPRSPLRPPAWSSRAPSVEHCPPAPLRRVGWAVPTRCQARRRVLPTHFTSRPIPCD